MALAKLEARASASSRSEALLSNDEELRVHDATVVRVVSALRASRRTRNHKSGALVDQLRCECALPGCRATVPAAAQAHRKRPERFIVRPGHVDRDTVIAAADRFFVVEPSRQPGPLSLGAHLERVLVA